MIVGLVVHRDPRKGIHQDMDLLRAALLKGSQLPGSAPVPEIREFVLREHATYVNNAASAVDLEGNTFPEFMRQCDWVLVSEMVSPTAAALATEARTNLVTVPNADWFTQDHLAFFKAQKDNPFVHIWVKTPKFADLLMGKGLYGVVCLFWTTMLDVPHERHPRSPGPVRFVMSAGMGGYKNRRGVDIVLKAWEQADFRDRATLTIKTIRPLREMGLRAPEGVRVISEFWSKEQTDALWDTADAVLYPSRWEGFGLSLAEALDRGIPAIVPDRWPMNEQVRAGHNGLVVPCARKGRMNMAPICEVSPGDLVAAMRALVKDLSLLERLSLPDPGERRAGQFFFANTLRRALGMKVPLAAVAAPRTPLSRDASEGYWISALVNMGVDTSVIGPQTLASYPLAPDFVIASKIPEAFAKALRKAFPSTPIVGWHHDLVDYTKDRAMWQRRLSRHLDLTILPEGDLDRYKGELGRVLCVLPGIKIRERPPYNPFLFILPETPRIVFAGTSDGGTRDSTVRGVAQAARALGWEFTVRGAGWAEGPASLEETLSLYFGAIVLCPTRGNREYFHTSNRPILAAGAGAVLALQGAPGIEDQFPGAIMFDSPSDLIDRIAELRKHPDWPRNLGAMAEVSHNHEWRRGTWELRVLSVLDAIGNLSGRGESADLPGGAPPRMAEYWDRRAKDLGDRAVGHIGDNDVTHSARTREWWNLLKPHADFPVGGTILDFGCGVGRFTSLLGSEGFRMIGVDASAEMLSRAQTRWPAGRYVPMRDKGKIDLPDACADVIWTATVLQHIPDEEIQEIVSELRRVLKPGGAFFLYENVHSHTSRTSKNGHMTFRAPEEYVSFFPGVQLVFSHEVRGELHALFTGRTAPTAEE